MDISATGVAFAVVGVTALVLFATGTPGHRGGTAPAEPPDRMAAELAAAMPAAPPGPTVASASADGVTLRSVSFEFPTSDRTFPGGAAAAAINNNCTACHSAGMVLTQPRLTRADWEGEVNKMRATYKAPVPAEDVPAIVAWLADNHGVPAGVKPD